MTAEQNNRRYGIDLSSISDTMEYINAESSRRVELSETVPTGFSRVVLLPFKEFLSALCIRRVPLSGFKKFFHAYYSALFVLALTAKEWERGRVRRRENSGHSGDRSV